MQVGILLGKIVWRYISNLHFLTLDVHYKILFVKKFGAEATKNICLHGAMYDITTFLTSVTLNRRLHEKNNI